jgi:hypothetical protein
MGHTQVMNLGLGMQVIERTEAGNDGGQISGDRWIGCVGVVLFFADAVAMDLGMEGVGHLAGIAAEVDEEAACGHAVDGESLLGEPLAYFLDVAGRWAELLIELLRGQPMVEVGGVGIVLLADEGVERLFAGCAAAQHKQDVIHGQGVGSTPAIDQRTGLRGWVPGECLQLCIGAGHRLRVQESGGPDKKSESDRGPAHTTTEVT